MSVSDICSAIYILMKNRNSGIFNICSGIPVNLIDVAKNISKNLKKKINIINSFKYTYLVGNNLKLKSIGWTKKDNIKKIIKKYLIKIKN